MYFTAPLTPVPPTCDSGQFQCVYLLECLPQSWHCDGDVDCVDGSDEEDCGSLVPGTVPPQAVCEDTQYHCAKNICIPALLRCDSVPDCPNSEDEYECRKMCTHTHIHTDTCTQSRHC